jgi:hypothetical protein
MDVKNCRRTPLQTLLAWKNVDWVSSTYQLQRMKNTFGMVESSQFFQNAGFMSSTVQLWPEEVLALSNSCGGDNNFALQTYDIVIMF